VRENPDRPEYPLVLQHAVVSILGRSDIQDVSRAFAIAVKGTLKLTPHGKRVEKQHQEEAAAVLAEKKYLYEHALGRANYDDDDDFDV
jgi:hypothetical protein